MAAEDRRSAAEPVEFIEREKALVGQNRVEREASVPLAEDRTIAVGPLRLAGPVGQDVVVEHAHDLDKRERRSDVAAAAALERTQDQPAQVQRPLVQTIRGYTDCRRRCVIAHGRNPSEPWLILPSRSRARRSCSSLTGSHWRFAPAKTRPAQRSGRN